MLNTKQPVLRRFWYAVMPLEHLKDGPKPFTLLGEAVVLFLDAKGQPAALEDRCCPPHRQAVKGLVQQRPYCLRLSWLGI